MREKSATNRSTDRLGSFTEPFDHGTYRRRKKTSDGSGDVEVNVTPVTGIGTRGGPYFSIHGGTSTVGFCLVRCARWSSISVNNTAGATVDTGT